MANALADVKDIDSWTIFNWTPTLNRSLMCFEKARPSAVFVAENVVPSPSGSSSVVLSISPISRKFTLNPKFPIRPPGNTTAK